MTIHAITIYAVAMCRDHIGHNYMSRNCTRHDYMTISQERLEAKEALEHAWFTGVRIQNATTLHYAHTRLQQLSETTRLPVHAAL